MVYLRTIVWSAISGVTLLIVAVMIGDPLGRGILSLAAVSPVFYFALHSAMKEKEAMDRRTFLGLRKVTDDFLAQVRNLNRLKMIAEADVDLPESEGMVEEVVAEMHRLVEEIRHVAGHAGPVALDPRTATPLPRKGTVIEPKVIQPKTQKPASAPNVAEG